MSVYTEEIGYLWDRRPGRLVAFAYNPGPGAIDVGGHKLGRTGEFRRAAE